MNSWRSQIITMTCLFLSHTAINAQQPHPAFKSWDQDNDGFVTTSEFPSNLPKQFFNAADTNQDGKVSVKEDLSFRNRNANRNLPRNGLPENIKVLKDITYETVEDRKLPLDLYVPREAKEAVPLIVWIHGGGWQGGSKNGISRAAIALKHGYAVASVEYRLSGEAIFPAAIQDCKAAISFLRLNAHKYNLDPDRIGVWGSSAGGHLVALLGVTNDSKIFDQHPICSLASPEVQAVCNWFGPTDFLRMNDFPSKIDHDAVNSPESKFIGGLIQENPEKVAKANPITYVTPSDPPMLLMHGEKDMAVPYNQSELLHEALKTSGVNSTLFKVVGGDHGFRGAKESPNELGLMAINFFDEHLKKKSSE